MTSEAKAMGKREGRKSLGTHARQGVIWLSGSRAVEHILSFFISAILARLLTPADYGLLGMATVILSFLGRFADLGTGTAIIQQRDLNDEKLSSIFWLNALLGATSGGLLFLAAPLIARFYREPTVQPVIAVLAATVPLQALAIVPDYLLRRRLQFDRWVARGLSAVLAGGALGLAIAAVGGGVWALVAQQLGQASVGLVALWIAVDWHPRLVFRAGDIREISGFTSGVVGFNFLNYLARNVDNLLIGRFLGSDPLGLYTLAYRLMRYPVQTLSGVASQALFPVFSRMQDDQNRLSSAYIRTARYILSLSIPITVGMALTAEDFLVVLFGPQWREASSLLTYLALASLLQPATSLYTAVIWARGYTRWQLRYATIQSGMLIVGFAVGLRWGSDGVALSYLITTLASSLITVVLMFPKCGVGRTAFLQALGAPLASASLMVLVILLARVGLVLVGQTPQSALGRLTVDVGVGAVVYVAAVCRLAPDLRNELDRHLRAVLTGVLALT
ncbi:MAG: lipopolysaccharide biosynthesis protein [bacterium]